MISQIPICLIAIRVNEEAADSRLFTFYHIFSTTIVVYYIATGLTVRSSLFFYFLKFSAKTVFNGRKISLSQAGNA